MSVPGSKPASPIASTSSASAASLESRSGAKPPSSPTAVDSPASAKHLPQRVVGLGAPPQGFRERGRSDRDDHELLQIHVVVGVGAAVDHVHHRRGKHVRVGAAHMSEEGDAERRCRRMGGRQRCRQHRIGAETSLVHRGVELDEHLVDGPLFDGIETHERAGDLAVHMGTATEPRPCRRNGRCRHAARPPRTGLSRHPRARSHDRRRPPAVRTSASTVGLPRESSTSRPVTWTICVDACAGHAMPQYRSPMRAGSARRGVALRLRTLRCASALRGRQCGRPGPLARRP